MRQLIIINLNATYKSFACVTQAVQQISQDMQSQLSIKDSHVSSLISLVQHLQCQLAEEQAHKAFHKFRLELQFAAGQQAQEMLAKAQASERAAQLSLHMMVVQADYLRRANLLVKKCRLSSTILALQQSLLVM